MKKLGMVNTQAVTDVECDRCHRSCKIHAYNHQDDTPGYNMAYATLEARWPYGSPKDTEHHQLHFCEPCYDWLTGLLKENGVEVRVAEENVWSGRSEFDVED